MCGVIGFYTRNPSLALDPPTLKLLFRQSKIRGLHAFGFTAWLAGPGLVTYKGNSLEELEGTLDTIYAKHLIMALVGHTRYSTSGDWKKPENNQPIHLYEGNREISLAFNGVISMKTREEYSREYGRQYATENDGEIFARKVLEGEQWEAFVRDGSFSFAGCFLHGGELWALRNSNRPLWYWKNHNHVLFASTKDIFRRAFPDMPGNVFWPLPAGKAYKAEELLR